MRSSQLTRDFLFLLYALYFAQGFMYPSGSIISQSCLLLILLISGIYFIKSILLEDKKSLFYNTWTLLILLNIVGFLITTDFSDSHVIQAIKAILGCMLSFYPFYYFAKTDDLKADHLIRFFLIMLPITIIQFFTAKNHILSESISEVPDIVNNTAYMFVSLMPFVFLIKKKRLISGVLMALIIIFIIQGAKRGAIIAGSIGLLFYFYYQLKTTEKHNRVSGYLIAIIIVLFLSAFAYKTFMSNEFLINRMISISQGEVSGRDEIYKNIFNKWYNSNNVWNFVFGFGFGESFKIVGTLAHNDWLELLSSFGLIGISVYICLFYAAIKHIRSSEWTTDKRFLILTITMIWLFTTMVSMWYLNFFNFTQAILLGYLTGSKSKNLE